MQITWTITNNCEYIPDEKEWPTTINEITRIDVPKRYNIFDKKFKFLVEKYNKNGPLKGCWLTTAVLAPKILGSSV